MTGSGSDAAVEARWQRVAAYVVCLDAGRILLTHLCLPGLPAHGSWTLPGGGLDWGEQPVDAAHRELAEETGLTAELGPPLGVWSAWLTAEETATGLPGHALAVLYEASGVSGTVRTEFDEGSTDGAAWFAIEDVPALPRVPVVDAALALLRERDPYLGA